MPHSINQLNQLSISRYGMDLSTPALAPKQTEAKVAEPKIEGAPKEQPPRASQTELNRLMQTLARETYSEVDSTKLLSQAKNLSRADKNALQELSDRASSALQAIKDLSVNDIIQSTDGAIEELFETAADLQLQLGNKLRELADSVNGQSRKFRGYPQMLNELSLTCDARGSEIMTLYMEVRAFSESGAIGQDSTFSTATTGDLLKGMAGSMHGNDKSLLLEKETGELEASLSAIKNTAVLKPKTLVDLFKKAQNLSTSLKSPQVAQTMDPALHAKLTARLDDLFSDLLTRAKGIARHSSAELLKNTITINVLGKVVGEFVAKHKKDFPTLDKFLSLLTRLDSEGPRNASDFSNIDKMIHSSSLDKEINRYLSFDHPERPSLPIDFDSNLDLRQEFLTNIGFSEEDFTMAKQIGAEMNKRQENWGDKAVTRLSGEDVVNTFRKDDKFSMIVEARINGATEKDINSQLCDKNLVAVKKLGSGAANTVYKMTYRMEDGSTKDFVFKPDLGGRIGFKTLRVATCAYASTQQTVKLNTATCDVADLLGLGRLTGKNYATVHDGQYGLLMEMAPGTEATKIKNTKDPNVMDKFKDREFVGALAKELNELRWLDIATGQGDRHNKNYLVDITTDPNNPRVTAIDNDLSFTPYLVGIGKFDIKHSPARFERFKESLTKACAFTSTSPDEAKAKAEALMREIKANKHIVDTKSAPKEVLFAIHDAFGYHSCSIPKQMSRALNDKLIALTDDQIREFALQQTANLDSKEAITATENRLKELRDLALDYKKQGLVVEDSEWATNDKVLHREVDPEIELNDFSPKIDQDVDYFSSSMLHRDFGKLLKNNLTI